VDISYEVQAENSSPSCMWSVRAAQNRETSPIFQHASLHDLILCRGCRTTLCCSIMQSYLGEWKNLSRRKGSDWSVGERGDCWNNRL